MERKSGISFGDGIPAEMLRSQYGSVSAVPAEAAELAFRLVLPRVWSRVSDLPMAPLASDAFSLAAAFKRDENTNVQILITPLPFEVNLVDWLEFQAYLHGFKLAAVLSGETSCGQTVHAAASAADGSELRLMVVGNGPKVVLLVGTMPAGAPSLDRETLGAAAASFEFLTSCRQITRERIGSYLDRESLFQLQFPGSWSYQAMDRLRPEKAGVDFRLTGEAKIFAYLRVEADTRVSLDDTGLEQLFQLSIDEIEEAGVSISQIHPVPEGAGVGKRERWLGECTWGGIAAQVALLFRRTPHGWLSAILLCPEKSLNPMVWMRAKRAYEIAAATLSVVPQGE